MLNYKPAVKALKELILDSYEQHYNEGVDAEYINTGVGESITFALDDALIELRLDKQQVKEIKESIIKSI